MKDSTLYALRSTLCVFLIFSLLGCDAFVRKFTRKPKKEDLPKEEMVLQPQEYKTQVLSKEDLYRQYFLYWESWHEEFIESLSTGSNHKKQIDCVNEAIKNLHQIKPLLNEMMQQKLGVYIGQLNNLAESVIKDVYANSVSANRLSAERIKRNILREFSYSKVKGLLS